MRIKGQLAERRGEEDPRRKRRHASDGKILRLNAVLIILIILHPR